MRTDLRFMASGRRRLFRQAQPSCRWRGGHGGVVIGMSTTVLEEAVLLGRPVIQIKDADFLKYIDLDGVSGARCLAVSDITSAAIESAGATAVDTAAMRERLGLNRPEVAYGTLFS
jgi:hypothetical protein